VLPKKNIYFPSPLFGFFDFFCLFQFSKSLKKNKIILGYKGGTGVVRILVPSTRNTLMLIVRIHVQEKDTRGKFVHRSRCQVAEAKCTRLAYKACFKGSIESNMEPALGQRLRDENMISKT
jgi:hypothetical protein